MTRSTTFSSETEHRRNFTPLPIIDRLWDSGTGYLSVQVLQEFFVTVTRKVAAPLSIDEATDRVRELALWRVFAPTADDVLGAIGLQKQAKISFWDAMIVRAAAESGCDLLWTEDLSDVANAATSILRVVLIVEARNASDVWITLASYLVDLRPGYWYQSLSTGIAVTPDLQFPVPVPPLAPQVLALDFSEA